MSPVFNVSDDESRGSGIEAATAAVGEGKLVVLPTDTVYGVGADPFNPDGVAALLAAKGRGREKPPAVLVPNAGTVEGLAMNVPSYARRLMERFWPGGLTLIFRAQPSLMWDLGDTNGTVGLRMPDDEIALELLRSTGPMAVSSANRTGEPTARTITEAGFAFGPAVEVYLDGGERGNDLPSTIIDCTKADPIMLRRGAISPDQLHEVLGPIELLDSTGAPVSERARPESGSAQPSGADAGVDDALAAQHGSNEPSSDAAVAKTGTSAAAGTDAAPAARGVGAEPPFEREQPPSVELPGRSSRSSD